MYNVYIRGGYAMSEKIHHLPNSELEIMLIIWAADQHVTRADIETQLQGKKDWGATTILKFLSRLVEKGFLKSESQGKGKPNIYSSLISEQEYLEYESTSIFGKLCGRSIKNLVATLYRNDAIDETELNELKQFLDKLKQEG